MSIFKKKKETEESSPVNVRAAYETLQRYKSGKASLESRIIANEEWWKLRHYSTESGSPPTAWLFNCVANKHADAMDSIPAVICLPREKNDIDSARLLTDTLPVILDGCGFENVYSDCWYDKLKHGSACYGVFWNRSLDRGLGNIDVRRVDLLNLFWEPGVSNIQNSRNVFHVELWDNDILTRKYPALADVIASRDFDTSKYIYEDAVDTSDKSAVIDWYYKKDNGAGAVLHYCKLCCGKLLYCSEDDPEYASRGYYDHGMYPFVIDRLYPIQGTPCGFGVVDAMKGTQTEIDALNTSVVRNARMAAERRFFVRADGAINEEEFSDWSKPFIHYSGSGDPASSVLPVEVPYLSGIYVSVLQSKIEELKETSGNRDFSQGTASGGVTAAAAIAALQEAGSKNTRDMLSGTYRCFEEVCILIIELIRQFYTISRHLRISGKNGDTYVALGADNLRGEDPLMPPVYDLKVRAHKKSEFSRLGANELACQLYQMGVMDPVNLPQAEACLAIMDFEGKDELLQRLRANTHSAGGMIP